jgi:hypothetical protein
VNEQFETLSASVSESIVNTQKRLARFEQESVAPAFLRTLTAQQKAHHAAVIVSLKQRLLTATKEFQATLKRRELVMAAAATRRQNLVAPTTLALEAELGPVSRPTRASLIAAARSASATSLPGGPLAKPPFAIASAGSDTAPHSFLPMALDAPSFLPPAEPFSVPSQPGPRRRRNADGSVADTAFPDTESVSAEAKLHPPHFEPGSAYSDLPHVPPIGSEYEAPAVSAPHSAAMSSLAVRRYAVDVNERSRAVHNIQRTLGELGTMYTRLTALVAEQGEGVMRLVGNVDKASDHVDVAQQHLDRYLTRLKKSRWLLVKIILLLFFFAIVFAMIK